MKWTRYDHPGSLSEYTASTEHYHAIIKDSYEGFTAEIIARSNWNTIDNDIDMRCNLDLVKRSIWRRMIRLENKYNA